MLGCINLAFPSYAKIFVIDDTLPKITTQSLCLPCGLSTCSAGGPAKLSCSALLFWGKGGILPWWWGESREPSPWPSVESFPLLSVQLSVRGTLGCDVQLSPVAVVMAAVTWGLLQLVLALYRVTGGSEWYVLRERPSKSGVYMSSQLLALYTLGTP